MLKFFNTHPELAISALTSVASICVSTAVMMGIATWFVRYAAKKSGSEAIGSIACAMIMVGTMPLILVCALKIFSS